MKKYFEIFINHPKLITWTMVLLTVFIASLALLPSLWPDTFTALHPVTVNTDPEDMLPEDNPVRVFHDRMKKEFDLYDMVVMGVVNKKDPNGVFNPESLKKIYEITKYAKTLKWPDKENPEKMEGIISVDVIAPSTVDNIEQAGPGTIKFEWLMPKPPETQAEALAIKRKAERIPFLNCTLFCHKGEGLAIYLPMTSKGMSYKIASKLKKKVAEFTGDEEYYITGLPIAEDTFGVEMFVQMVICAPLAMFAIFLLMLYFFKKLNLILSPLIIALVSVIGTMGLLVATGNTIHIMSSMIPIFIMPIAVLDAVHILSEFFDRYQETKDRKKTILNVLDTLFMPMLFTSLTTAVGFGSLALAPIPPVQVFGLFVAIGVSMAWVWTIAFIPAYIMLIPEKSLENFGFTTKTEAADKHSLMPRMLAATGRFTFNHAKLIIFVLGIIVAISGYGITLIKINDNPIKWFEPGHPIRVADKVLNKNLGGTYMAYLVFEPEKQMESPGKFVSGLKKQMEKTIKAMGLENTANAEKVFDKLYHKAKALAPLASSKIQLINQLEEFAGDQSFDAPDDEYAAWDEALRFLSIEKQKSQIFKNPEMLKYIASFQDFLTTIKSRNGEPLVGKSNTLADIVKTVYRELMGGKEEAFRIPGSSNAVAQTLIQFQNSHRPRDLWHFVTPDYRKTSMWLQLKSGDNMAMETVTSSVKQYLDTHPAPINLTHKWFGLTYINVVWQNIMVKGMISALIGSFISVLVMMIFLFRSVLWGILSMIPLTVTIGFIYGVIGLIGKNYDMPVAVLSSMSLGLSVDYAIHFLARSRKIRMKHGTWEKTVEHVFGEPARAITRNVLVIGIGFLPLLIAPLVPYQTVGIFISAILISAGVSTLVLLPAMITLFEKFLFKKKLS